MLPFCVFQPLEEWSTQNVIDWMAALNLYRYAELFRDKKITGRDLIRMNEDSLLVSCGWLWLCWCLPIRLWNCGWTGQSCGFLYCLKYLQLYYRLHLVQKQLIWALFTLKHPIEHELFLLRGTWTEIQTLIVVSKLWRLCTNYKVKYV